MTRLAAVLGVVIVAVLLSLTILIGIGVGPDWLEPTPAQIDAFVASWGMWSAAAAIMLMVVHSFVPFPAEMVAVADGMMFGPWWGVVVTWTGAMLGATSAFAAARWLGRPFVCRFIAAERRATIERWTTRPASLLLLRLLPVVSFNLVNFAAGLAGAAWWAFLWTTALGILPLTVASVVLGARIFDIAWWGWLLVALAVIGVSWLARSILRTADSRRSRPER